MATKKTTVSKTAKTEVKVSTSAKEVKTETTATQPATTEKTETTTAKNTNKKEWVKITVSIRSVFGAFDKGEVVELNSALAETLIKSKRAKKWTL